MIWVFIATKRLFFMERQGTLKYTLICMYNCNKRPQSHGIQLLSSPNHQVKHVLRTHFFSICYATLERIGREVNITKFKKII